MKTDINKLLIILRDNLDACMTKELYLIGNNYFGRCYGLCASCSELYRMGLVTYEEYKLLLAWLNKNLPPRKKGSFCWKPGLIWPRKRWLNKMINSHV
jgi:hypothetical protein